MSARAGIHVKQAERGVADHLQNVRMAADEKPRPQSLEFLVNSGIVIARIASDVRHVDLEAIAIPGEVAWQVGTQFGPVDVAVNAARRFELPDPVEDLRRPEISGVPDFIAFGEVLQHRVVEKTVVVRK